ncbi:MAG: hypothetical protein QOJ32_952, partial [Frankiaceae bacterium]|nr:hypothetical protein [Frankiaceae bacterium]
AERAFQPGTASVGETYVRAVEQVQGGCGDRYRLPTYRRAEQARVVGAEQNVAPDVGLQGEVLLDLVQSRMVDVAAHIVDDADIQTVRSRGSRPARRNPPVYPQVADDPRMTPVAVLNGAPAEKRSPLRDGVLLDEDAPETVPQPAIFRSSCRRSGMAEHVNDDPSEGLPERATGARTTARPAADAGFVDHSVRPDPADGELAGVEQLPHTALRHAQPLRGLGYREPVIHGRSPILPLSE